MISKKGKLTGKIGYGLEANRQSYRYDTSKKYGKRENTMFSAKVRSLSQP